MSATWQAVYSSLQVQFKLTLARAMMKYVLWIAPLVYAALGAFTLKAQGAAGVEYSVVGAALITLWGSTIWTSVTDIVRERWMGNFEYLLISPVSLYWSTLGKNLGNVLLGLMASGIGMLYSRFLFQVPVGVAHPLWLLAGLVATALSFLAFSMCMGAVVVMSRQAVTLMNGFNYPIYILAGLMFSLDGLPAWTRPLSMALPLTWARQALGSALTGVSWERFAAAILWLVGLCVVYAVLGWWAFRSVDRKVREKGELG